LFRQATIADLQVNLSDIYFDFDKSELRPDARSTLSENADWLKKSYNTSAIEIEGHCDERGTEQYNLGLGERRARAALDYLASLGVPGDRLKIISYGEERPQCTESDEDCWQRNRRSHFKIVSK
jgi:peptidoglycan-associated lipoprotein